MSLSLFSIFRFFKYFSTDFIISTLHPKHFTKRRSQQNFTYFINKDYLFIITVEYLIFVLLFRPTGQFAYAFTKNFLLIYDLDNDIVSSQLGNVTWPDTSFLPHAVDISHDFLIVVLGYVGDSSTKYTPCAYLLNISNSTFNVLDTWLYTPPTNTSWQASLTNWDADVYAPKYDMSVSINNIGNQVLFGIQIINTILIINIDRINRKFGSSLQTLSNGKAIGMGKTVDWIDTNLTLVLVNTYSLSYIWSSSQIFSYNVTLPNTLVVQSIFPNIQQALTSVFGPILLSFVITKNGTVVMLDSDGNYYILLPSPAGSFSDTSSGTYSSSSPCIAGTFTSQSGIFPCSLCPSSTTTAGLIGQFSCVPCENDTFCTLAAAFGNISLSSSILMNINQARAYPVSPQSTRFDNILIENMFKIQSPSTNNCIVVSPLFWTVIVISIGLFTWIVLFIFKRHIKDHPMGKKTFQQIKRFLKKTDLIGEGEMVIGGLFSFGIIVLVIFAYLFSGSYLNRYPIETVTGDAKYACDKTLTNAQFGSGLMALGVPPDEPAVPMFTMLDAQPFTLYIDFINTLFKCTDVSVIQVKDINLPISISSCNNSDSIISFSLLLPSHTVTLQVTLAGINTIGGVRIGLEGPGGDSENATLNSAYTLADLSFAQTLSMSGRLLTQQPSCTLGLTKIINRTYSLEEDGETEFSGLWLPTISGTLDQMFIDASEYNYATSTSTIFSLVISEGSSYVLNVERPITDEDELIFTNLLFTILCLEIFGLGFLIFKLIIIPLIKRVVGYCCHRETSTEKSCTENVDLP
jgi:hypothetical protein